ncbi:MAG: sugar phosphate isomerase/epimerase family protein [Armatimonadota bacterium]
MSDISIGLQLYTVRDETRKDFPGTLRRVAEIGYAGVEFAGFEGQTAEAVRALLDETGLFPAGAHIGLGSLQENIQQLIDYQLTLGNRNVTLGGIPAPTDADGWKKAGEMLSEYGRILHEQGLQLGYHNHAHEFKQYDGEYALDILFGNSDPRYLHSELDLFWVTKGGEDPVAYINKYANRLTLLHMKDMAPGEEQTFAEVGEGILDWPAIIAAGRGAAGVQWFIVEQDVCQRPTLESAAISYQNLKRLTS